MAETNASGLKITHGNRLKKILPHFAVIPVPVTLLSGLNEGITSISLNQLGFRNSRLLRLEFKTLNHVILGHRPEDPVGTVKALILLVQLQIHWILATAGEDDDWGDFELNRTAVCLSQESIPRARQNQPNFIDFLILRHGSL